MSKVSKRKLLSLAAFLAVGVAFGTQHFSQAQVGGGLDLSVPPLQVINGSTSVVYQHKYVSGAYGIAWRSAALWGSFWVNNLSLGDVDNDGFRELAAVLNYKTREVRIKGKKVYYYDQKIVVFENGCPDGGLPSWESLPLGESSSVADENTMIADVDNDGNNEIVLVKGRHIEIYDLTAGKLSPVMKGNDYPYPIFSIDAGDADNDGKDEIVLSIFHSGGPIIWKYEKGTGWSSKTAQPIPSEYYQAGFDWLNLDYARVRDADNIVDEFGNKGNEIVGGGNNDRLMIWKYDKQTGDYDLQFVSEDLGGFTQGVDAGDVDADGFNEVVIGSLRTGSAKKRVPGNLCIFTFNGVRYVKADSFPLDLDVSNLGLGDLDYDGRAEIALSCIPDPGLRIFDFIGSAGTGDIRLAYGGDGFGLEIR